MTFTLPDHWVWDFWFADDGDLFHLYYLHAPKALGDPDLRHRNARIGHATSRDLAEWFDLGPVLTPGDPGDFDETATWTGSVLRGPDGVWRMFYTGSRFLTEDSVTNVETIGLAKSIDLHSWVKVAGPVAAADARWYETLGHTSWPEEAWRDPWVFADPAGNGWHMLVTARSNSGADEADRGVIGHATSDDLERWEVQPPLSTAGAGFTHLEVPQIAQIGDHTVLLFSCDTKALAGARSDVNRAGGIWLIEVDGPTGPFDTRAAALIAPEGLYSGRLIQDRSGDWVLLAFENTDSAGGFVGILSDPYPIDWPPRIDLIAAATENVVNP